jgi:hypothetical protein
MGSRRRTRLTVLAVHITGSGFWLGALATTLLLPAPPPRLVYALAPTAGVVVVTGWWLARGLWRFGWVRAKATLTVLIVASAGVTQLAHLTGRPGLGLRYAAVTALLTATVVAVIKPHRTGKATHDRKTRQVVPRTETDQSGIRKQGGTVMDPRREPALILGLIAAIVQVASAFVFHLTIDEQGTLNAVAVAVAGLLTALAVKSEQLAPLILGLVQAVIAVGLAFGLVLSPDNQSVIMSLAAAVVAMFVRSVVVAPVAATVPRATVLPIAA